MTAAQSAVLTTALSAILRPILVAAAALIGLARARKTVLVLAVVGLLLYLTAQIVLRSLFSLANAGVPVGILTTSQSLGPLAISAGAQAGSVGGFLALIRTAQIRRWRWFGGLLAAVLVSAVAGLFLNAFVVSQFTGTQRALELLVTPPYAIITNAVFCVSFLAQILYGIFGPDGPADSQTNTGAVSAPIIP
jgi:hypothetical protein